MVTIYRAEGFRVEIYVDDHAPAHVHVLGDGEAKTNLLGSFGRPELIWAENMKRSDIRRAVRLVIEHQDRFLLRWRTMHG